MATLAHNLDVRRSASKGCYAGISVGWIGNAAHQAEQSDHNPDARGIVHAIDVMVTGARAQAVVNWALAHPADLEYAIHNRTIWTKANNYKPKKYLGKDPHTNHVHLSGEHGATGENSHTGCGYNTTAEKMTPTGSPCKPAGPVPKPKPAPKPSPSSHKPGSRTLKQGMTGPDVKFLQVFIGPKHCGGADGKFGSNTTKGVRWYQGMRGLHVDGICGPDTWRSVL